METTEKNDESLEDTHVKEKQLLFERTRSEIFSNAISGNITNTRDRVAYLLNTFPDTRNSDIKLVWFYWKTFESKILNGGITSPEQLRELTDTKNLTRIRQAIQNGFGLFQADDVVKKFRGTLEQDKKSQAIEQRPPSIKRYSVHIDESGKTQDYLSVGSLWILDHNDVPWENSLDITDWKKQNGIRYEFHFVDLKKDRLDAYKQFWTLFLSKYTSVSFKAMAISKKGITKINEAITDLTYHLLKDGVTHEHASGRATLPRMLEVVMDEDEPGADALKIKNVIERLDSQKINGLSMGRFEAVSSKSNTFIQIIDLFTGSINRKLNGVAERSYKDDFADYVCASLGISDDTFDKDNTDTDKAILFTYR